MGLYRAIGLYWELEEMQNCGFLCGPRRTSAFSALNSFLPQRSQRYAEKGTYESAAYDNC